MSHTPGPWTIDRSGSTYKKSNVRANGWITAWLPDNSAMVKPSDIADARKTDEANARLVAAAPEMLELLRMATEMTARKHWAKRARALLARIEG